MGTFAANLITSVVSIYTLLILATVLFAWLRPRSSRVGQIREFVNSLTAPYLRVFRRIIRRSAGSTSRLSLH